MVEMRGREQQAQEPGGLGCSVTYHVSAHASIYTRVRDSESTIPAFSVTYSMSILCYRQFIMFRCRRLS